MKFEIACKNCGEQLKVDRRYIGRKGKCPKCHTKFIIPDPDATPRETPVVDRDETQAARVVSTHIDEEMADEIDEAAFMPVFPWHVELVARLKIMPCWLISALFHAAILFLIAGVSWQVISREPPEVTVSVQLKDSRNDEDVYLKREDITKDLNDLLDELPVSQPGRGPELGKDIAMEKSEKPIGVIGIGGLTEIGTGTKFTVSGGDVSFFGSKGGREVSSVVFVVDCSGSMDGARIKEAKAELKQSISALNISNRFSVLFFSSDTGEFNPDKGLLVASGENKQACYEFIESTEAHGYSTDPRMAMQIALRYRPDLIYLLTDGQFHYPIDDLIAALNKNRHTKINTIGFKLHPSDDAEAIRVLKRIAAKNRGTFKHIK